MAAVEAVVDLGAIAYNVQVVGDRARAGVMAVVKADGYGHGATQVARAALSAGAAELGVATVDEAMALRRDGITAPIATWLHTCTTDFAAAVASGIEVVVSSVRQLSDVAAAAEATGTIATVGVKVDTGLGRGGAALPDWPDLCEAVAKYAASGAVVMRTAMTHLARGDEPQHPLNDRQAAGLDACVAYLRRAGAPAQVIHMSNSAAALTRPDLSRDLVRAGIAVYGRTPIPAMGDFGLEPALTLTAEIAVVKRISAGQGVSYNHTWVAPRDTTIAVIACGYADGIPRVLSNGLTITIGGRSFPNVGRICMDQFVVDLGPDETRVTEGDRAVLFGTGAGGEPTAADWARAAGTIDYEILSGIRGRTVRRYVS
ncbi:alanine racemase [Mycolicibacterium sarraceniae]|uniref:Alanine racemase n=1 Tax=Mycolicibacterium sarraceniae TaxID=1534348 RepID=A0A7I7T0S5_9MYCO|nr:alanine racemase [Mycolicibacterium sarraceniae]BBY61676.1 alanine racemase [Mycolicibacterium sarraceniae]